jgi:prepilin-type N-terminal cleavage/methylation domain-containing protein
MAHTHKKNGFTLVELAIVLVIVGLLAGGVIVGQAMIRSAELQSAVSEINQYKDAVVRFQDKYAELPGDMSDATSYWGELASSNCENANVTATGDGNDTCNGDGDGLIDGDISGQEWYHAWVHMRNAGLIEGRFTGTRSGGAAVPGTNIPASVLDGGGYALLGDSTPNSWLGEYEPYMVMGAQTANDTPSGGILKPEEAWNIDTKLDDGVPSLGKVRAFRVSACSSVGSSTADHNGAAYALSLTGESCALIFTFSDPGLS